MRWDARFRIVSDQSRKHQGFYSVTLRRKSKHKDGVLRIHTEKYNYKIAMIGLGTGYQHAQKYGCIPQFICPGGMMVYLGGNAPLYGAPPPPNNPPPKCLRW